MTRTRSLAPLGLGLALLVAGCSAGGTTNPPAPTATDGPAAAPSGAPQPEGTARAGGGGVTGTIAYVSGQLMQVQGSDMQTAVGWTDGTTITSEVAGTAADVVTGVCVTATSAFQFTGTPGGATGTAPSGAPAAVPSAEPSVSSTAARVVITDPVDGKCTTGIFGGTPGGFTGGGGPGGLPSGMPTALPEGGSLPSGIPTDLPSGGAFARGGLGARAAGMVTAFDGTTITVQATAADGTASSETATVDASTTYTRTVKADASAIVVGQCASAFGPADSSGKVAATSISVSAPVNGTCSSFGTTRGGGLTGARNGNGGTGTGGTGYGRRGGNGGTGSTQTQGGSNA